jgi:uncharacterized protein (TIGR02246 family)
MSQTGDDAVAAGARAAYARWFAALEAGDVAGALEAVTEDVVQRSPAGAVRVGRDALGAALAPFLRDYAERVRWELTVIAARGDEVDVRVREETVLRARGGGPSLRATGWHAGRVRCEGDGVWRIAEDSGTVDGPPVPLAEHEFELPGA